MKITRNWFWRAWGPEVKQMQLMRECVTNEELCNKQSYPESPFLQEHALRGYSLRLKR